MADTIWVRPQAGMQYRDVQSRQLVPADGFEADTGDLDINRAIAWGDLVVCAKPAAPKAAKAQSDAPAS